MPHYDWQSFKIRIPNRGVIPVPEVATDPNGGSHLRRAPGLALHRRQDEITASLRPISTPNSTLGPGGTSGTWPTLIGYELGMRSLVRRETIARDVRFDYQTGPSAQSWWSFEAASFFGKRLRPSASSEPAIILTREPEKATTRPSKSTERRFSAIHQRPGLQLSMMERPRYVRIPRTAASLRCRQSSRSSRM